ncbi:fimbrial protein [Citrobacter sp. S-77]|uniref:fimbrial protein n=1 Tax=Citrobacter sp. S-77 TaxID=1080067 RepID=UPI0005EED781|nr:fimbrial protein [Citrobacter sp. S-77]
MEKIRLVVIFIVFLTMNSAYADRYTTMITVSVKVVEPACVVNENKPINVDFSDHVAVTDVAAGLAVKDIEYTLQCYDANPSSVPVNMYINGYGQGFDKGSVQTSLDSLAIRIKADGVDFPLNTDLVINSGGPYPKLTATLIKAPNRELPTGSFTAEATMVVYYP